MKMKKNVIGTMICVSLLMGMAIGVNAESIAKEIKAILDPSISVVYNDETVAMKDGNGNVVYPIMYNGSTYIPVRAVSEIFGQKVDWDGGTKTVYIGTRGATEPANLAKIMGAGNEYCWKIVEKSELSVQGDAGYATYDSGIERRIWNSSSSSSKFTLVPINVSGKSTLTFTVWSDIDADILILDENGGVITSFKNSAGSIVSKEIDITGHSKIAFGANAQKTGVKGTAKFFNPTVK